MADIKLKLRRNGPLIRMLEQFDVSRLKDADVRKQFILQVCNRFAVLENVDEEGNTGDTNINDVEQKWKEFVQTYTESSQIVLGNRQKTYMGRHQGEKASESTVDES